MGDWRVVPVYALERLEPGHVIEGPAVVEAETTTLVAGVGDVVSFNGLGWLEIRVAAA